MPAPWMFQKGLNLFGVVVPPGNGISGLPLLVMPILDVVDAITGAVDPLFVANVTATVVSGPGAVTAGGIAVGVLGVVTFVGLTITGSGVNTIEFSAPGVKPIRLTVTIT